MPANTPVQKLPYPLPTEPIANGAVAIQNLALSLDNRVPGALWVGIPGLGTISPGSSASNTVTFPAGLFTTAAANISITTGINAAGPRVTAATSSTSLTSTIVQAYNGDTVGRGVSVCVFAMQISPAAVALARALPELESAVGFVVVCQTEGCDNSGIEIPCPPLPEDIDPETHGFTCGVCLEPINDVRTV
jgi:hypothetical protein